MTKIHSFTRLYNGISPVLEHDISVCKPGDDTNIIIAKAIWDTGATNSVINQRIIDELGLESTGFTKVHTASEKNFVTTLYTVDIFLNNDVKIVNVNVTKGELEAFDCLLGMDIIRFGDFAVTNLGLQTCVSFRLPSQKRIDFVEDSKIPVKPPRRNDLCSCGSGLKYKLCHGKTA